MASLSNFDLHFYGSQQMKIRGLKTIDIYAIVEEKYKNFVNIFSFIPIIQFPKHKKNNHYAMKLTISNNFKTLFIVLS